MTRVGFIGLGNMGGPMCGHVVAAGFEVTAFDRDVDALARAVAGGARGSGSAARLAIYVGGEADAFQRALPLLDAIGDPQRIFHLGSHGSGYAVKLLLNLTWFMQAVATAETLAVGARAGVELDKLHTALVNSPANSNFLERDVRMVLDDG